MPRRANRPCRSIGCPGLALPGSSYCEEHKSLGIYKRKKLRPAYQRGHDQEWKRIRIEVLKKYGIPEEEWVKYVIDHRPPYDPAVEPNHRCYTLIPMLRGEHSVKTNRYDGGWGNPVK